MSALKLGLYIETKGSDIAGRAELASYLSELEMTLKLQKFGTSDLAGELTSFNSFCDPAFINWVSSSDSEISNFRFKGGILDFFAFDTRPTVLSWRSSARSFEKKLQAIEALWLEVIPDASGVSTCYTGYAAHGSHEHDQKDSEYANLFNCVIRYPVYHAATGEYLYDTEAMRYPLSHLDLLPGLTWRIAMGQKHFEHYNISPEDISKVCISTEEVTAANGDRIWQFQSREDPLDWRDSYERQLKLGRPDVFFDIAPLRERFAEPVDIENSGRGGELDRLFKKSLIELYPASATKDITV